MRLHVTGCMTQEALIVLTGAIVGGVMSALASNWSSRSQYTIDILRRLPLRAHEGVPDRP
jgi:hypothetical protein